MAENRCRIIATCTEHEGDCGFFSSSRDDCDLCEHLYAPLNECCCPDALADANKKAKGELEVIASEMASAIGVYMRTEMTCRPNIDETAIMCGLSCALDKYRAYVGSNDGLGANDIGEVIVALAAKGEHHD